MIFIASKKKIIKTLYKLYPEAEIIDVTSNSEKKWVNLSPFFPHGGIPVPNSEGVTASCVEAIWQGLKVFETTDIDTSLFTNTTMKNIKRTVRKFGVPLGHRYGVKSSELLTYIEARKKIFIPTYMWVLENKVPDLVKELVEKAQRQDIVLLDYNTNEDVENTTSPLSHASLIKKYIETNYNLSENHISKQLILFEDV